MIEIFLISLFATLIIVRVLAHNFHDMENYDKYNPRNSKAKTITGFMRRKTGFDWHHIHFGFILILISIFLIMLYSFRSLNLVLLGIGLSMVADQITPLINRKSNYFSNDKLILSILIHIIIALLAILMTQFYPELVLIVK